MHLSGEKLAQAAGVELLHVGYRGGGPAILALVSGEVVMMPAATLMPRERAMGIREMVGRAARGQARQRLIGSLVIAGLGVLAVAEATGLPLGSMRRIGPGVVPWGLGIAMIGLGIAFFFDIPEFEDWLPGLQWRPMIAICAAMLAFAGLVSASGMYAAIFGLVAISEFAERGYDGRKVLASSLGLCLFVTAMKYLLRDSLILDLY